MDKMIFEPHAMHGETVDGEGFPLGYISIAGPIPTPVFALEPAGLVLPGVDMERLARLMAEAPAMVEALRNLLSDMEHLGIIDFYDQDLNQGIGGAVFDARAILSRIDGAGEEETACASCGAEEGESHGANCESRGFSLGVAARRGDTLPDAPVPAPTGELVTVRADHLAALVGAAGKYADDLETGLEDGTYDDRADLDAVQAAIAAVQGEN